MRNYLQKRCVFYSNGRRGPPFFDLQLFIT
ncbi:uncharacterized protein METZ01_LOCUS40738 [marine metagenome]|uniref:Uncharacterized protein n=1 Tax=marine metagenome TaxID=408172 RepID=A0A381R9J2_9ZZZZ